MKLYLYIDNEEQFLQGDYALCLRISDYEHSEGQRIFDWIPAGVVDVEIDVDANMVRQLAVEKLDKRIKYARAEGEAKVRDLENRKQDLLAISHQPEK